MSPVSNEYILYTLAQVATTLAGFSGLLVVFRVRGAQQGRHLQAQGTDSRLIRE